MLASVSDFALQYDIETVIDQGAATPIPRHYLRAVRIELQTTPEAITRLHTAALVLNAPEVTTP